MTALQGWISSRPMDPRTITAFVCDAIRGFTTDDESPVQEPRLISRGLERC